MFTRIMQWLILSSKDPHKFSLTIKGALLLIVPVVSALSGLSPDEVNTTIDLLIVAVENFLFLVAGVMTIYGAIRKIWATVFGKNKVLN